VLHKIKWNRDEIIIPHNSIFVYSVNRYLTRTHKISDAMQHVWMMLMHKIDAHDKRCNKLHSIFMK
jgi:hypothetical protein